MKLESNKGRAGACTWVPCAWRRGLDASCAAAVAAMLDPSTHQTCLASLLRPPSARAYRKWGGCWSMLPGESKSAAGLRGSASSCGGKATRPAFPTLSGA